MQRELYNRDETRQRIGGGRGERKKDFLEKGGVHQSLKSLKDTCISFVARNAQQFSKYPIPEELKEKIIREMIDKELLTKVGYLH